MRCNVVQRSRNSLFSRAKEHEYFERLVAPAAPARIIGKRSLQDYDSVQPASVCERQKAFLSQSFHLWSVESWAYEHPANLYDSALETDTGARGSSLLAAPHANRCSADSIWYSGCLQHEVPCQGADAGG
jgi:hypothetical protein